VELSKYVYRELSHILDQLSIDDRLKAIMVDDPRITIISQLTKRLQISAEENIRITTAISLLQLSLDLHEDVSNLETIKNAEPILLGDQLAARYYQLLVEHEQLQLINRLARATKNVNQFKMQLIESSKKECEFLFIMKLRIETELLIHLMRYVGVSDLEAYYSQLYSFYLLQFEREKIKTTNQMNAFRIDQLLKSSETSMIRLGKQLKPSTKKIASQIKIAFNRSFNKYKEKQINFK